MEPKITFEYDSATGIRTATFCGEITDECLIESYSNLVNSADFVQIAHELTDFRSVEKIKVTRTGLQSVGKLLSELPPPPVSSPATGLALVAGSSLSYGFARMYQLMNETKFPKLIKVFRDIDKADKWLRGLSKP